jgi:DNA topoisomerase IA
MLRDLHKVTGVSASNILKIAEELYSNEYISYPRTDTDHG